MTGNCYVDFMFYYSLAFHRFMIETEISQRTGKEVSYILVKNKQESLRHLFQNIKYQ